MDYLLDTNVLIRAVNPHDAQHPLVVQAISTLLSQGCELYLTPQVIIEFWGVSTRPSNVNGLGWLPSVAASEVQQLLSQFPLLEDTHTIFQQWMQIVSTLGIRGKQVHDARLVAVMQVHHIPYLLTFNGADFKNYIGIVPVEPANVIE